MDKKKLEDLINSLIDNNEDQARTVFHDYLGTKTKEFIRDQTVKNNDSDTSQQ